MFPFATASSGWIANKLIQEVLLILSKVICLAKLESYPQLVLSSQAYMHPNSKLQHSASQFYKNLKFYNLHLPSLQEHS